ncbi:hypothetical protein DITRI_Ditri07aG0010100 [Diplodiscus trichospermus]
MASEYAMHGYLTDKSDVYSFGIVALKIVSGRSNTRYCPKEECFYLLDWTALQSRPWCAGQGQLGVLGVCEMLGEPRRPGVTIHTNLQGIVRFDPLATWFYPTKGASQVKGSVNTYIPRPTLVHNRCGIQGSHYGTVTSSPT